MTLSNQDIWSDWLRHRRHGDDPETFRAMLNELYPLRDKVLDHADLGDGNVLLDIGCGDGLIAVGALDRVKTSKVIFSDISRDLLNQVRGIAQEMGMNDRCRFLEASADDLSALSDSSVDVVTTRSVLIYVSAKQQAFNEFYRVLKPQGRLSIFEPINRFRYPIPPHIFGSYDVTPVMGIAQKIKDVYFRLQPMDTDPMLNFGERDLIAYAEKAGFAEIHLELQVEIKPPKNSSWAVFSQSAGNPKIPTLEEAMHQALTHEEIEQFTAHLRPLVEARAGVIRSAVVYLWAVKN